MFGFEQWDSPLSLLLEVIFTLGVFSGIMIIVRRVNAQPYVKPQEPGAGGEADSPPTPDATQTSEKEQVGSTERD